MGLQNSVPCWVVGRMTDKLPFGGEVVRLGDVCEVVGGATPKTGNTNYWNGSIRWITPAELNNESHVVTDTAKHLTMDGFHSASLRMMPAGTVLLTTRAPIGKVAIAGAEMCCNQGFKNFICSSKVYNEYLYRYLKFHAAELQSLGSGATFKELSKRTVSNLQIYLPTLDFQHEAVKKLSEVDRAIGYTNGLTSTLSDLVKSRFVEMFGNRASGEIVALRDCCSSIVGGKTPSMKHPEYYGGGIPFIKSGDVIGDRVFGGALSLSDVALEHASVKMIPAGSVLVVTRSARLRKEVHCAVCASDVAINQDIKAFTPLPEFTSDYLLWAIRSHEPDLLKTVRSVSTSGMDLGTLFGIGIRKAPLSLQQQFVAFVQQADKLRFEQLVALKKRGSQHLIAP